MTILYIDSRCTNGTSLYLYSIGLVSGLSGAANITLVSSYHCSVDKPVHFEIRNWFYKFSDRIKNRSLQNVVKGFEYMYAYAKIILLASRQQFDVIHVEWPILYGIDAVLFKILKKKCKVFSLKAHNILPHSSGTKNLPAFQKLYHIADVIEVHGLKMKQTFKKLFPEEYPKVVIQHHGNFHHQDFSFTEQTVDANLVNTISKYRRIYLFIGRIDPDKGVDRLVRCWHDALDSTGSLLIIAGKIVGHYPDFDRVEQMMSCCKNLLYIPGLIDNNLFNFLVTKSHLIILPYRDGSMSGVAFTAAAFRKPVLTTKFGVIEEYIDTDDCGFVIENDDDYLKKQLLIIDRTIPDVELNAIGDNMYKHFGDSFEWNEIGRKLAEEFEKQLTYKESLCAASKEKRKS